VLFSPVCLLILGFISLRSSGAGGGWGEVFVFTEENDGSNRKSEKATTARRVKVVSVSGGGNGKGRKKKLPQKMKRYTMIITTVRLMRLTQKMIVTRIWKEWRKGTCGK